MIRQAVAGFFLASSLCFAQLPHQAALQNAILNQGGSAVALPPDPTAIFGSDLAVWYDASDAATITQSGGLVSQINDKSGHGFHMTAAGTARPAWTSTTFQSHFGGLSFNGSTNTMLATHVAMGVNTFACFVFGQLTIDINTFPQRLTQFYGDSDVSDNEGTDAISASIITNTSANPACLGTKHNSVTTDYSDATNLRTYPGNYLRMGVINSGSTQKIFVDEAEVISAATSGTLDTAGTLSLGSRWTGASGFWHGVIGEYVLIKRVPNATEIAQLGNHFLRHWTRVVVAEGDSVTWAPSISTSIGFPYRFIPNSNPKAFVMDLARPGTDFWSNVSTCLVDRVAVTNAALPTNKGGRKYILFFTFANQICGGFHGGAAATPQQYADGIVTYCTSQKSAGWDKIVIATALSRTDSQANDTNRNAFNAIIKNASWNGLVANGGPVDAIVDFAGDSIMGVDASPTVNPTYWLDQIHPNAAGHTRLEAIFTPIINGL